MKEITLLFQVWSCQSEEDILLKQEVTFRKNELREKSIQFIPINVTSSRKRGFRKSIDGKM